MQRSYSFKSNNGLPPEILLKSTMTFITVFILATLAVSCNLSGEETTESLKLPHPEAEKVYRELLEYDSEILLESRTVELKEFEYDKGLKTVREKIIFRGVQGFWCSAYLEYPTETTQKLPCILLLHGWSGSKESWWKDGGYLSGGNLRKALLQKGFAVFSLDAQIHGDRISVNDFAPVNHYRAPGDNPRTGYFQLGEIYLQTVRDYRRGLDYLETRKEIDMDRIGLIGYSMGGTQCFMLTGGDWRIKVAVACVVPSSRTYGISYLAPENYLRPIGKRPLLLLMGKEDPMHKPEHLAELEKLLPTKSSKVIRFDSGHKLPVSYVPDAVKWMTTHFSLE